jgi:hypothetical protein
MNIDYDIISNKFPKSFGRLINFTEGHYFRKENTIGIEVECNVYRNICFCDFTDFFDSEEIVIEIIFHSKIGLKWSGRIVNMNNDDTEYYGDELDNYETRPEAQVEAVYQAFKIMEAI